VIDAEFRSTLPKYRAAFEAFGFTGRDRRAWYRGRRVAALDHPLAWYRGALAAYTAIERRAFLAGFEGRPFSAMKGGTMKGGP